MALVTVYKEVDIDIDLRDFDLGDLIDEVERHNYIVLDEEEAERYRASLDDNKEKLQDYWNWGQYENFFLTLERILDINGLAEKFTK